MQFFFLNLMYGSTSPAHLFMKILWGTITLNVIFGEPANFRKEKIEFEVVDWKS